MLTLSLKDIKSLVKCGLAEDITFQSLEVNTDYHNILRGGYRVVGTSTGVYGCNGLLIQESGTRKLMAVTGRTSNLFRLLR